MHIMSIAEEAIRALAPTSVTGSGFLDMERLHHRHRLPV
jgi:hypothetical protein